MTKETMMLNKISTVQERNLRLYRENKKLKEENEKLTGRLEETLELMRDYKKKFKRCIDETK